MDSVLLKPEIQDFIKAHIGDDVKDLALRKNPFPEVTWIEILSQIAAKSKARVKLPSYFETPNIIYPSKVSVEQTSSEQTAQYKSSLVSGESLIDLTGGFGVDDYYFAKKMKSVVHCEIDAELAEIVRHNFEQLGTANIECYQGDSHDILKELNRQFDWIYIDPSRRSEAKGKVFMLKDCAPNVPGSLDFYFKYAKNILIKTAPILDITAGLSELKNVKAIHIIALDNEVKELLWELSEGYTGAIAIRTVNIIADGISEFGFTLNDDSKPATFALPKAFLYEPNSAIMKSGGFEQVSSAFKIDKLHAHSHLYTSEDLIDFPGRAFKIEQCISYHKTEMKQHFENQTANITTRNFPEAVETIRKRWKIKHGGNRYCFFTTDLNDNKIVLICSKISKQ